MHRTSSIDSCDTNGTFPEVDFLPQTISPQQSFQTEFRLLEKAGLTKPEPLLMEDKTRFVLFPIRHTDVCVLFLSLCLNIS
jgi:hypothetical protein